MTSHPLGHGFETMMEKGQDQVQSTLYTSTLADPNPKHNLTLTLTLTLTLILTLTITITLTLNNINEWENALKTHKTKKQL